MIKPDYLVPTKITSISHWGLFGRDVIYGKHMVYHEEDTDHESGEYPIIGATIRPLTYEEFACA